MKTLYISDLDGTLLNSDIQLNKFTVDTINQLIEKGMLFSFATARSYSTAGQLTADITAHFPLILFNGAVVVDNVTGQPVLTNFFTNQQAWQLVDTLMDMGLWPLVYHYDNSVESMAYVREKSTPQLLDFIHIYEGKLRHNLCCDRQDLKKTDTYYLLCIGDKDQLYPAWCRLKDIPWLNTIFHADLYTGRQWLEIMPVTASKANAIMMLKEKLGCDRVVCFGDGKNDISMFEMCDEKYAVANAVDELKAIATAVIGSNNEDGVARWLAENRQY